MENMLCLLVFVAERHPESRTVAISVDCLISCKKLEDIQMILQLSELLSATNICEQNTFSTCDFIFMQHNCHSDKVIL